jgi:hypothetical protein
LRRNRRTRLVVRLIFELRSRIGFGIFYGSCFPFSFSVS